MSEEVKPTPSGMHVLTVRMPAEMIGQLSRRAKSLDIPVSEVVRRAVYQHLNGTMYRPMVATSSSNPSYDNYIVQWISE